MKHFPSILLLFILLVPLQVSSQTNELEKGLYLIKQENHKEAIKVFTKIIKEGIDSTIYIAYYNRGLCEKELGNANAAIDDFNTSLEIDKNDPNHDWIKAYSYTSLARIVDKQHNKIQAKKYLLEALKFKPKSSLIYSNLALVEHEMGYVKEGLKWVRLAIDYDNSNPYAWNNYSRLLLDSNEIVKAKKAVDISLDLNPYNPYAYKNKALILIEEGNKEEACKNLYKAKSLNYSEFGGKLKDTDYSEVDDLINSVCNSKRG